ncbi:hypothetical protein [Moorena bouillonii]|uniref:hypothetical protein n=1 Tax=Moorena bouillonii TaxID=207920 RepID=UPI0013015E75|nr:hypothetical protein [Moorena bouillonii]
MPKTSVPKHINLTAALPTLLLSVINPLVGSAYNKCTQANQSNGGTAHPTFC